jgi:DNA-binding transcriptional LysR family regulator
VTLTQLRFAAAVARAGSFSAAAASCHVSQPSLSAAIAKLEGELGGALFSRSTRHVAVTPLGAALLPLIAGVLDGVEHLGATAAAALDPAKRVLRLGLSPLVCSTMLAETLKSFAHKRPDVSVILKQCFLPDLRERLGHDTLDAAVVPSGFGGRSYDRCPFYADPLHYLPGDASPDAPRAAGPVTLQGVAADTFVLTADGCGLTPFVKALFRRHGQRLREYPGVALNHHVIEEWTSLGLGAGLLPLRKLTTARRRSRPLVLRTGRPVMLEYELVWRRRGLAGPHVTALIRHVQATAAARAGASRR